MFSVLGMMVVGLGMLSITQRTTESSTDNQADAAYYQCQQYQLTQMYYRGNQGWVRNVPLVGGKEQWSQGEAFRMFVDLNANPTAHPGSGEVQDIAFYFPRLGRKTQILMARGNSFFVKNFPNKVYGTVDWGAEAAKGWYENSNNFPNVQAFGFIAILESTETMDKTHFYSTLYQDNKGYTAYGYAREIFESGTVKSSDFNNTHLPDVTKTLVVDLSSNPTAIPGSGPVQAIGDYVSQDNTVLNQVWYRGNIGYMRQVPIRDYKPDYSSATPIQAAVDLNKNPNALPGYGDMQATTNFISCKE